MTKINTKVVFLYLVGLLRSFPVGVATMLSLGVIYAIDRSLKTYVLKVILDRAAENSNQDVFAYLAAPIIAYLLITFVLQGSYRLYDYFVNIQMIPKLRKNIANHALGVLVDKDHNYFQNNFAGSLTNKVSDLVSSVPDFLQIAIDRNIGHGLALLFSIYALWHVNIRFAICTMVWSAVFILGSMLFSKRLSNLANNWSKFGSTNVGNFVDVLSNVLSVRLFCAKEIEKKSLDEAFQKAVAAEQKLQWSFFWMWVIYGSSFVIILGINLYFLLKGRQEGLVSVGDFALVLVLNITIVDFLWEMARDFSQFSKHLGKITQGLEMLFATPELVDSKNATELSVTQGRIDFNHVKFHYKGNEALFQDKSVTIQPGQKVGLVGYSGGGKTTFVNLILRLYEVNQGEILIDRQDIKTVTQDSLRKAIGMIPQDPSLFHRSLMDNIRYGRIEASDAEVIEASKRAHAHEFIAKLPNGYDSLVGERGVKLSGGQRQRIAIARAILKNAPILILDEATSQLDSVTEHYIQESLWELMQGKTTIVIAHRLSTLLQMDRILVFDQGKIQEDGTHQELLAKAGLYSSLWNAQVGGFLGDEENRDIL